MIYVWNKKLKRIEFVKLNVYKMFSKTTYIAL
jgi:hypothetical protein